MKFLRVICNILLFVFVFFGAGVIQICVYDLYAVQSEDVQGIHVIAPNDDGVAVVDSVGFWGTDIGVSISTMPKYRVRNWISANWWKNSMIVVDKGIDVVGAVVKPILLPISEINAVKNYYDLSINDFTKTLARYNYEDEQSLNNALYEYYVIFNGKKINEDCLTVGENPVSIYEWDGYNGKYIDESIERNDAEYGRWVANNKKLYNHLWKLEKYNKDAYNVFYNKFILKDSNGDNRHIKSAAVVLYYQFIVSIVAAAIFVWKYPINLLQYSYSGKKKAARRRHEEPLDDGED